jgi:hypothetical protein
MIGDRMRALALSTAFAIICSAPPAIAAQFDGNWIMVAVTTSGHCGEIPIDWESAVAEFILLVEALSERLSLITRFSWWGAFPPRGRSG